MEQTQRKINSRIGPLYLVASEKGLQGVFWTKQRFPMVTDESERKSLILKKAELQLEEYLSGKRKDFDLPLDPRGTEFQKRVWEQLTKIPYGQTRSYKDIAKALNQESASRAVGSANGQNPLSIIVPCHRVISSNGSLGGYAGGLGIKEALLSLEKKGCPH
jgi:methylated-DNA-[protein]-cysteine S-methyltransferase